MGTQLKPGGMTQATFSGSMAEAIEQALNALLVAEGKPALPTSDTQETWDRRRFFVAIARGVVDHLNANEGAFVVTHTTGTSIPHQLTITT